jgi:hypothetical protein
MTENDKLWIEKCKEDWNYTICVDNDEIFVVHTDVDEVVYTFSLYGYEFAKALLQYIGCDADYV